ncbi:MAG: family 16 glycosylhydrolase [Nonlabens sp.]
MLNVRELIASLFILGFVSIVTGQQMPVDFEDNAENFTGFSGTSFNFVNDPEDSNNTVGEFSNSGSATYQGAFLDLSRAIDLDTDKVIGLRMRPTDNNSHTIILKLENGANADVEVSRGITAGNLNNWVPLTFDFANAVISGQSSTINATGEYSRITVFIDGGQLISGTFLIDDIDDGTIPTNPIDVIYTDLVWSDEFNTPGTNNPVSTSNWFHQTQTPLSTGWYNGEDQLYTDRLENSYVENGNLYITAKREQYTDPGNPNLTKSFTSARLNSKYGFTYGRVDVRAKLPLGEGTWPAIWTLGKNINEDGGFFDQQFGTVNWPACGELDVMEHGLGITNHVSSAVHTPSSSGNTVNTRSRTLQDVANDWHIYSMNWSPNKIVFLVDDVPYYTYNPAMKNASTWPFDSDQYMLLNVAMGGFAGPVEPGFTQSSMIIDYVRVFQNTAGNSDLSAIDVKIYPNPTSSTLNLRSNTSIDRVAMYNAVGSKIDVVITNNNQIDVSNLTTGIYFVEFTSGNQRVVEKVVVE